MMRQGLFRQAPIKIDQRSLPITSVPKERIALKHVIFVYAAHIVLCSDSAIPHTHTQASDDGPLIRFFDNKTCYTVHGENAVFVAREYYKTTAVVKYICGPPATGLPSEPVLPQQYEDAKVLCGASVLADSID
jgi:hypothetical protein